MADDDDDDEEIEVYYVPKIPKITIPPISFDIPSLRPKPVSPGIVTPADAPIYTPEWIKRLKLMTAYGISVYINPVTVKELELAIEYGVSLPEFLEATKNLSLKTEVSFETMKWYIENNLLLKIEPGIFLHYGTYFDAFLKLKTDYTATVPEFKTYESDLLLKIDTVVRLMSVVERAKNLGLSVEVGIIPTIGVTTNIYAGTRVEVELSFIEEILMTVEDMLKTSYDAKLMIIPITVSNELETAYSVYLTELMSEVYPGYTVTDFLDRYVEKTVKLEVGGRVQHETEVYPGYSYPVLIPPNLMLVTGYSVSLT